MPSEDRRTMFKQNLHRLMEEKGLTPRQLAIETGLPLKWVKRACDQGLDRLYKRNERQLGKVAAALGISSPSSLWRDESSLESDPLVSTLQELLVQISGTRFEEVLRQRINDLLEWCRRQASGGAVGTANLMRLHVETKYHAAWHELLRQYGEETGQSPDEFIQQLALLILEQGEDDAFQQLTGKLQEIAEELGPKVMRRPRAVAAGKNWRRGDDYFTMPDDESDDNSD